MTRVQVVLPEEEREVYRRQAKAEGLSLSAWFRAAAQERLSRTRERVRIRTQKDLKAFFEACDKREAGRGAEPDWEDHLSVMDESRKRGASGT